MSDLHEKQTPAELERDAITLAQLAGGNPDGLQRLLQDHGALLRSRLRKDFGNTLDDSEIDEVMSAMVFKVWNMAGRFDASKGSLRAWASVITHNTARRFLETRRRIFMRPESDLDRFPSSGPISGPISARQRLLADLHRCLRELPPLQGAVLQADLAAGGSAPAEPLAKRFATTANSIYVSRQKGRKALRKAMQAIGHLLDPDRPPPRIPRPAERARESHLEQE